MKGLINSAPTSDPGADAPAAPGDSGTTSSLANPLLQAAEGKIEARLTPDTRADFDKVVVAGLHIALANGPRGFMAKLTHSPDPIGDCAKGAVALLLIMQKESRGVMPMQAGIPAAYCLMLHGLDFIDHSGVVKIAEPEMDRATTQFANNLFHRMGITPQMLQHASNRVHQIVQDPTMMARINLKAGLSTAPGAATTTPVPGLTTPAGGG